VAGNILLAIPYQVPAIIAQVCVLLQGELGRAG